MGRINKRNRERKGENKKKLLEEKFIEEIAQEEFNKLRT